MKRLVLSLTIMSIMFITSGYGLRAQETDGFTADTTEHVALSSGWEDGKFTATFLLSGTGGYAKGKWKLSINPPFPHPVSGIDDSYVQTALGLGLLNMEPETGMSWLLRAALQNEMDAIMILAVAYASNQKVKNVTEAERWFRKAIELGNPEAETQLDNLLAGKSIDTSVKASHGYSFGFSLVNDKK